MSDDRQSSYEEFVRNLESNVDEGVEAVAELNREEALEAAEPIQDDNANVSPVLVFNI